MCAPSPHLALVKSRKGRQRATYRLCGLMQHPEKDHGSMRLFWNRPATILALIGLAAFVFMQGIVPAFSKLDADFPGYFTAAKIVASGRNVEQLYDDSWFREQI